MCGIIGYIGHKEVIPILLNGLKRLEYRGYDSSGIAVLSVEPEHDGDKTLSVFKKKGKIKELDALLNSSFKTSNLNAQPATRNSLHVGIGHTRWATHGKPDDRNAHPHTDCSGKIAVVHNGIIENYGALKKDLISEGHRFSSETDTEVIAHLIERESNGDPMRAVIRALKRLEGSYAIGFLSAEYPEWVFAARKGSPLILGCGEGENYLASDVPAILPYTRKVIYLDDDEIALISGKKIEIFNSRNEHGVGLLPPKIHQVLWDSSLAEKGGYKHFMLKEIHEQPQAIRDTIGRYVHKETGGVHFDEMKLSEQDLKTVQKIYIIACGTSYHSGLIGKLLLERYAQVQVEVDIASEFRYRSPLFPDHCLTIAISQSGETADTIAALRQAKDKGAKVLGICNVVGSSAARESHGVLYTLAGPEIGVASTKAFTTQVVALYLFAIYLGSLRGTLSDTCRKSMIEDLCLLPGKCEGILTKAEAIRSVASVFREKKDFLYLGRSYAYPIALEGALKLKEISYIHAEAYAAGEMKHGPIALIDDEMPVVALTPKSTTYDKVLGNIEEVKARGGTVLAVSTEGDNRVKEKADYVLEVPEAPEELSALLMILPLQLLAYYIADLRGCHIDQPRNLAKSVTVE